MKILLVGFAKIKYMPYIRFYLDNIDHKNDIQVAYWNRDGQAEDLSGYPYIKFHEFSEYQEDNVARISKVGNFLKFRRFVKKILNPKRTIWWYVSTHSRVFCFRTCLQGNTRESTFSITEIILMKSCIPSRDLWKG